MSDKIYRGMTNVDVAQLFYDKLHEIIYLLERELKAKEQVIKIKQLTNLDMDDFVNQLTKRGLGEEPFVNIKCNLLSWK